MDEPGRRQVQGRRPPALLLPGIDLTLIEEAPFHGRNEFLRVAVIVAVVRIVDAVMALGTSKLANEEATAAVRKSVRRSRDQLRMLFPKGHYKLAVYWRVWVVWGMGSAIRVGGPKNLGGWTAEGGCPHMGGLLDGYFHRRACAAERVRCVERVRSRLGRRNCNLTAAHGANPRRDHEVCPG